MSVLANPSHAEHPASPISDPEAIHLLRRLVETSSVSGDERSVATLLSQEMSRRGLVTELDSAGNVIGWRGPRDAENLIILLGHMDTVPGMIPVRIEADLLFGRGSVDAKGPLATFVVAASRAALPPNSAIVVIGAVEEETPTSRGARAVIDRFRPAACVIGEPSAWNGVTIGYKGRLVMECSIARDLAHTAGPGGSAADEAVSFWQRVLAEINRLNQGRTGAFHTVQATIRELRTSSDGLTERASLVAGFRLPPALRRASCSRQSSLAPPSVSWTSWDTKPPMSPHATTPSLATSPPRSGVRASAPCSASRRARPT